MVNYDDQIRSELRRWLEEDIDEETSLLTLSHFLFWRGDFEKSIKYKYKRVLIFVASLDNNSSLSSQLLLEESSITNLDRAQAFNSLGFAYQKLNRFPDALQCLNTSIELYARIPRAEEETNLKRKLACAYNNRGLVYRSQHEFPNALENIQKSLELRTDDPNLSEQQRARLAIECSYSQENLSLVHKDLCEYSSALSHAQMVLDIRKKNLPSNHFMISQACNNIALIYTSLNNLPEATKYIEDALMSQIQALPGNHPHYSAMCVTLGQLYYVQGQYRMAISSYERALSINRQARVPNRLLEVTTLSNIGSVMRAQGNYDGALVYFLDALPVFEQAKPRHADIARTLNNIGFAYRESGRASEAIDYFTRALNFCNVHLKENDGLKATTYVALASVVPDDEYDLAMDYLQGAVNIYNHLGLPHHQDVIYSYQVRGSRHRQRDNHISVPKKRDRMLYPSPLSLPPSSTCSAPSDVGCYLQELSGGICAQAQ